MATLPPPKAICIEDLLTASPAERYLRCVALPGRQPGLGLCDTGTVVWKDDERLACELWVSADERLIAYRRDGAPPLTVRRAGRSLSAPSGKPVVLLDGDELMVGDRHVRIHVHGVAPSVHAPSPLPVRSTAAARMTAVAAAAVALSAVTGCDKPKTASPPDAGIEVRETPPAVMPVPEPEAGPEAGPDAGPDALADATAADTGKTGQPARSHTVKTESKPPPIEVRNTPPDPYE